MLATGQSRKTDATDAHPIALVVARMAGLRPVVNDERLAVLRALVDRRRSWGEERIRMVAQPPHRLLELVPGSGTHETSSHDAISGNATVQLKTWGVRVR